MRVYMPDVPDYLAAHPDIIPVLAAALDSIERRTEFAGMECSLEVYKDPEILDRYLVLYIRASHYPDSIMDSIEAVWADLDPLLADCSGRLLVTTDFRPPKWEGWS